MFCSRDILIIILSLFSSSANSFIFKVNDKGHIKKVVTLPDDVAAKQIKYGLEGIAFVPKDDYGGKGLMVVCLQRAWDGNDHPLLLAYDIEDEQWVADFDYPLDAPANGWVGLSDSKL